MKTLLIDNYDSFTYNLFQLLAEANGEEPTVVRNDGASWSELAGGDFDNVVISPGPGRPDDPKDFGVCADAIRDAEVPLLGVCLGHQGIGHIAGAEVVHAPEVMHGRMSAVYHDDSPLFADIPQGFTVVRYHSLCITEPLPERPRGDRLDRRRRRHGRGPPQAPGVGRPVPSRVDLHRLGPPPARQLPRPDRRSGGRQADPAHPAGHERWRTEVVAAAAPAPAPAGRAHRPPVRHRAGLREPLRRPPLRLLARQQQGRRALALLVHGRQRRPAQLGRDLRRRPRAGERRLAASRARSTRSRSSTTSAAR